MNKALLLLLGSVSGLLLSAPLGEEQVLSLTPHMPRIGEPLVIAYNSGAPGALLQECKAMTAEVLLLRVSEDALRLDIPMTQSGQSCSCTLRIDDDKARLMLLRFTSKGKTDDNNKNAWDSYLYGTDGKPLEHSHLQRASILQSIDVSGFKRKKDLAAARTELDKERLLYPDNWRASISLWALWMSESPTNETKAKIAAALKDLSEARPDDEEMMVELLKWFEKVGQLQKADEIVTSAIAVHPKGPIAVSVRLRAVYAEMDYAKKIPLLEAFLNDFPQEGPDLERFQNTLVFYCFKAGQYDKAITLLDSARRPDGMFYIQIAWHHIEKKERVEQAMEWARKGTERVRQESKPTYMSQSEWKTFLEGNVGAGLATSALGLLTLGHTREAERLFEEAFVLTKGKRPEINERLAECYLKNGEDSRVVEFCANSLRQGISTEKLVEYYRMAYRKRMGSAKGFDQALIEAGEFKNNRLRGKLSDGPSSPRAINFRLKSLDGRIVDLSVLRGKVVVLDFWATWCAHCKTALPVLEKVHKKYQDNPDVVILAIDTQEADTGANLAMRVQKYFAESHFTVPVLFDDVFLSRKYDIGGLPSQVVIDRHGRIRSRTLGFLGEQAMIDEMSLLIDTLLRE
ncbi:MAG: redoxin domain-containing protein [Acidobacteria bacterium]|nr:redoxin domain-containing protein [Acidobacteriota bacterium]